MVEHPPPYGTPSPLVNCANEADDQSQGEVCRRSMAVDGALSVGFLNFGEGPWLMGLRSIVSSRLLVEFATGASRACEAYLRKEYPACVVNDDDLAGREFSSGLDLIVVKKFFQKVGLSILTQCN